MESASPRSKADKFMAAPVGTLVVDAAVGKASAAAADAEARTGGSAVSTVGFSEVEDVAVEGPGLGSKDIEGDLPALPEGGCPEGRSGIDEAVHAEADADAIIMIVITTIGLDGDIEEVGGGHGEVGKCPGPDVVEVGKDVGIHDDDVIDVVESSDDGGISIITILGGIRPRDNRWPELPAPFHRWSRPDASPAIGVVPPCFFTTRHAAVERLATIHNPSMA